MPIREAACGIVTLQGQDPQAVPPTHRPLGVRALHRNERDAGRRDRTRRSQQFRIAGGLQEEGLLS